MAVLEQVQRQGAGLVEQALARNFDARLALARLEEARAVRGARLAQIGPQGGIEGSGEVRQTERIANGLAKRAFVLPWLPEPPVGVAALSRLV